MRKELREEVARQAVLVKEDYELTTHSWERNRVNFKLTVKTISGNYTFSVTTDNKLYLMLDSKGAKAHPIFPRNAGGALVFPENFTPRTQVGVIGSQPGGRVGAITVRSSVFHPGFEARHFSKAIAKEAQINLLAGMRRAMKRAVAVSGHKL